MIVQNLFAPSDIGITNIYAQKDKKQMFEAVKLVDDVSKRNSETGCFDDPD